MLVTSGLLNAWYFLPIVYAGWFLEPARAAEPSGEAASHPHLSHWTLLAPPAITAALALTLGILAGVPFGILDWAQRIAFAEYLAWGP